MEIAEKKKSKRWSVREASQPEHKVCRKCDKEKPLVEFYRDRERADGHQGVCVECVHKSTRYLKNKATALMNYLKNKEAYEDWRLRKEYGISFDERAELISKQNHQCAICGGFEADTRGHVLHVDHDHATGNVRGMLCSKCNHGIGMFKDDVTLLKKVISYLESNEREVQTVLAEYRKRKTIVEAAKPADANNADLQPPASGGDGGGGVQNPQQQNPAGDDQKGDVQPG